MRIRKRHLLFSSPHFPVTPPSDPHLNNRSPVVQLGDAAATITTAPEPCSPVVLPRHQQQQRGSSGVLSLDLHQPSDQPLLSINGCDDPSGIGESGAHGQHSKQDPSEEEGDGGAREESADSEEEKKTGTNHSRKGRILSSHTLSPSSPSSTQDGRWCEEEKAIPFKKRKGSFENGTTSNASHHANTKKMKARMKTKMNKKCGSSTQNNNDNIDGEDIIDDGEEKKVVVREAKPNNNANNKNNNNGGNVKKRGRGSALMEGSRCSRVNGRGWRCCQQTLVGYSLCEHHLGKGRLRSMTSVRSRSTSVIGSSTTATTAAAITAPPTNNKVVVVQHDHDHHDHIPLSSSLPSPSSFSFSSPEKQTKSTIIADGSVDHNIDDEKKPMVITKKRMKLGMVKARSISSLLGQTNTGIAVSHESSNK